VWGDHPAPVVASRNEGPFGPSLHRNAADFRGLGYIEEEKGRLGAKPMELLRELIKFKAIRVMPGGPGGVTLGWRRAARIQRSTTSTAFSTFALSPLLPHGGTGAWHRHRSSERVIVRATRAVLGASRQRADGVTVGLEPPALRHFTARFEPLG